MKPKLNFNTLADLPGNVLEVAASMPARAVNVSKQVLGPAVRVTRRELPAARRNSAQFARDLYARASAVYDNLTPWQRGGINE